MSQTALPRPPSNVASPSLLPWERQPGETSKQWLAYVTYRDLGPARTLGDVSRILYPGQRRTRRPVGRVNAWSSKNDWVDRARAWDAEQDRIKREAQTKARLEMTERHLQQLVGLQTKAVQRLLAMRPDELRPGEVLDFLERAMKLERTIRGEPTEIREERVSGHVTTDLWTGLDNYVAILRARTGNGGIPPSVVPGDCGGQHLVEAKADPKASSVPATDI